MEDLIINRKVAVSKDAMAIHLLQTARKKERSIDNSIMKEGTTKLCADSFNFGYAAALKDCAKVVREQSFLCEKCTTSYFADAFTEEKSSSK